MDRPDKQTFKKDDLDGVSIEVQSTSLNDEETKDRRESVLARGDVVGGRYKVLAVLGHGGAGVVYKVEQMFLKDIYALKLLHAEKSTDKSVARFHKEANAAHILKHHNLVRVHDFGFFDDDQPYFVMDYVEGMPLSERIRSQGCLSVSGALNVFEQVCDGLAYAHENGVVHRDLKPSNIMLTKSNEGVEIVKIVDFGIAKILQLETDEAQALTRTGEIFGSPLYMSPEQCLGQSIDHRSDIYSLGCSLFEALTGLPPFSGDSALSTMMKHQSEKSPTLKEATLGKEFPESLEQVVRKLLAKKQADRYQSMMAVKQALQLVKEGKSIDIPTSTTESKPSSRLPLVLAVTVLCIGALVLISNALLNSKSTTPAADSAKISSSFQRVPAPDSSIPKEIFDVSDEPYADVPLSTAKGRPWTLKFPDKYSLGTISPSNNSIEKWEGKSAKGLVTLQSAQPLWLSPSQTVLEHPQLMKNFRPDEISSIRLGPNPYADDTFCFSIDHLSGLRILDLDGTHITDKGLACLEKLPMLQELAVSGTEVTGNELSKLECLKTLHILKADVVPQMSKVVATLARAKSRHITDFYVTDSGLTDNDLRNLAELPSLNLLRAGNNKGISDIGVSNLVKLKNLEFLDLRDCHLTPACIQYLRQMPLKELRIRIDNWSDSERQTLQRVLPHCQLNLSEKSDSI